MQTTNIAAHRSRDSFPVNVSSWVIIRVRFTYTTSLKWSTMTWVAQILVLVLLLKNCSTNPGWASCSWSIDTPAPGFLSVSLRIDPYLLTFFLNSWHQYVLNIQQTYSSRLSLSCRNSLGVTPRRSRRRINLEWRCKIPLCCDLNSCWIGGGNSGGGMFYIWLGVRLLVFTWSF